MKAQQEQILEGARDLFFRHGMKRVTMDDISSHLGMSKKTLYQFHTEKEALVYEVTARELAHRGERIEEISKKSKDSIEEILLAMELMSKMMNKISPTVFYDLQKYYRKAWLLFLDFKEQKMVGFIEENLRKGIRSGLYRKELNVKIIARLRVEEIELGYNPDVYPPESFNIAEVQLAMIDHFLHGVVTLKGYESIDRYKLNAKT